MAKINEIPDNFLIYREFRGRDRFEGPDWVRRQY